MNKPQDRQTRIVSVLMDREQVRELDTYRLSQQAVRGTYLSRSRLIMACCRQAMAAGVTLE